VRETESAAWLLGAAVVVAVLWAPASGHSRRPPARPWLADLGVSNGDTPYSGDRRLLTTVSPNGDGFRDRAIVRFRLDRPATVLMNAVRTDTVRTYRPVEATIWSTRRALAAGVHRLVWKPAATTPPRTYILRLTVRDRRGRSRTYGAYRPHRRLRVDAPVVRVQQVEIGFRKRSYTPGEVAELRLATDAPAVRLQAFDYRTGSPSAVVDPRTSGRPMTEPLRLDWRRHRSAPSRVRFVRAGSWPSGLYFVRAETSDGRLGYAPFIVRPATLGTNRVAVVLSTNTWQAYNFRDQDGDGWGDSWYVSSSIRTVDLRRPYLDFGVPFRFKDWDLDFIAWLNRTGRRVDYLSDDDLERVSGARLASAYDLIVFPGHAEYVTARAYDVVERYRDLGGNLMFLSANNFFWSVRREGERLVKGRLWRRLGRPEAALVGVQYVGSDGGLRQAPYVVAGAAAAPWAFAGTSLADGDSFGRYGVEIDARAPSSPVGTAVLAHIPNLLASGRSAEMTYYETPAGAKVFAAGALNFAASIGDPVVSRLVGNLWNRLSEP
jgi:hypothetical protein